MKKFFLLALFFLLFARCSLSQIAGRYDIVIDELMADPTPQVGLPANEWIELKNVSAVAINLQGFRVSDRTGTSGAMPNSP